MNDRHIEQRLRDALTGAGAEIVRDGTSPPGLSIPTRQRGARWPLAAVVAAASVTLAFGVPFTLLDKSRFDPAGAVELPQDPAPLSKAAVPEQPPAYFVAIGWNANAGSPLRVNSIEARVPTNQSDTSTIRSVTAAPDQRTFYLTSHDPYAQDCSTRITQLSIDQSQPGPSTTTSTVTDSSARGRRYSSLAISPDGTRLAAWYDTVTWTRTGCTTSKDSTHGLVVFDLGTRTKHTWTAPAGGRGAEKGANALSWSLDGRYVVYPTGFPNANAAIEIMDTVGKTFLMELASATASDKIGQFRLLDTSRPNGKLADSSRDIPRDAEALAGFRSIHVLAPVGNYPSALTAFRPQGGARVLAVATYARNSSEMALVELRLGSGTIAVLDPDYNPNVFRRSW